MKNSRKLIAALLACAIAVLSALSLVGCGKAAPMQPEGACKYATSRKTEGRDISYAVLSVKNYGDIILLLDGTSAPETVKNFRKLVSEGFYDGLTFHRVMENFMIQGGDPKGDGTGGSDETIKGEFSQNGFYNDISHLRGVLSMARSSAYNSASSQFFICNADSTFLNGQYAAFGYVIAGMNIVDAITDRTASYGDSNGVISERSKRAVIDTIRLVTAEEIAEYLPAGN